MRTVPRLKNTPSSSFRARLGTTSNRVDSNDERRSRALGMLAHDLNNPLTAIRILAEMVRDEVRDPELRRDLLDIIEAADIAGALMDGMASLLRLDEGRSEEMTWYPMDAVQLLHQVVDRPALRRYVKLVLPRQIPISGDGTALKRAFTDMLINARKLVEHRSVVVSVDDPEATEIVLRIHHPGPGIPEVFRARLFELHGAVDLRHSEIPVAAAGLAYARTVVDFHGGSLRFEDDPAGGMDLVVRLPR